MLEKGSINIQNKQKISRGWGKTGKGEIENKKYFKYKIIYIIDFIYTG